MFRDRDRHARTPARETALACLEAGIAAARPERVVREAIDLDDGTLRIRGSDDRDAEYDLSTYDRVLALGGGKAAGGVATALAELLGDRVDDGAVVTTDPDRASAGPIRLFAGDHPAPTERNVEATRTLLELADSADGATLVLAVVTGGASALLCAPDEGLRLADLRRTTDALLESGATIDGVNAVRRRCSAIKGGGLARLAAPATVLTLAISDVVGDDPATIGSGPTVPDPTTAADALAVLDRYGLRDGVPAAVLERLEAEAGDPDSTAGGDGPRSGTDGYHVLAGGRTAVDAAADEARRRGYETLVLSSTIRGEAREVGRVHAAVAEEVLAAGRPIAPPAVVLSGGEVTVTVRGDGSGGPNQELALAAAIEFAAEGTDAALASVDTDGIDGPTDAAGAIVDRETASDSVDGGRAALAANDAGAFLAHRGALLEAGYTGTNVNDLRALVLEGR